MKLLDCTLRDGGYYTNWDFNKVLVESYCMAMESLPVDYIEVGYRSVPLKGYYGKYFYCPTYVLERLKKLMPSKKIAIILNEKDIKSEHVNMLLEPCIPFVTLVRIAVDPINFKRAIGLAKTVKELGFEVAFNVMYMSNWKPDDDFLNDLIHVEGIVDYFYMVDSFGGVMPNDVKKIMSLVRSKTKISLGFHGHNNMEMALANTLTAYEEGCEILDATITGMGRGAGNLKTELFLTYLSKKEGVDFDYNILSKTVSDFENLKIQYGWGTSLPYMVSGAFSLPQKQVMEWVSMNRYSMETIVNALNNKKENVIDNLALPYFEFEKKYDKALIIGGGVSVTEHKEALEKYINQNPDVAIIFSGVRYLELLSEIQGFKFVALSGREISKLANTIEISNEIQFVYPAYPRLMGTIITEKIKSFSRELKKITFTGISQDSPLSVAIQIGLDIGVQEFSFVGFDGYDKNMDNEKYTLSKENQNIFNDLLKENKVKVTFFTETQYEISRVESIYGLL